MGTFIKKTKEERIEEILNAATKVFLEKGYQNTTMEDIIKNTTLSKGGFYYYFKSTRDIFFEIMDKTTENHIEFTNYLVSNSSENKETFDDMCDKFAHKIWEQFDGRTLYVMAVANSVNDPKFLDYCMKMEDKYIEMIKKSLQEKLIDIDPEILEEKLKFFSSLYHALIFYGYIFNQEELYKKNVDTIKNIFMQVFLEE